jgi:DNA-directed RNA polymerase sigma subunit (sigma70/sigma32)
MNLTRERVRQLETQGLAKMQGVDGIDRLRDYVAF